MASNGRTRRRHPSSSPSAPPIPTSSSTPPSAAPALQLPFSPSSQPSTTLSTPVSQLGVSPLNGVSRHGSRTLSAASVVPGLPLLLEHRGGGGDAATLGAPPMSTAVTTWRSSSPTLQSLSSTVQPQAASHAHLRSQTQAAVHIDPAAAEPSGEDGRRRSRRGDKRQRHPPEEADPPAPLEEKKEMEEKEDKRAAAATESEDGDSHRRRRKRRDAEPAVEAARRLDEVKEAAPSTALTVSSPSSSPSPPSSTSSSSSSSDPPLSSQQHALFKQEELQCVICFDLPPSDIYQCIHGHLLCHKCLTSDHAVMVRSGWRALADIYSAWEKAQTDGTALPVIEVLTVNRSTEAVEWKRVTAAQRHPADAQPLYRMLGEGMDVVATADHSMLVGQRVQGKRGSGSKYRAGTLVKVDVRVLADETDQFHSSNTSTATKFAHHKSRVVVRSARNHQPSYFFNIAGINLICDWWRRRDDQLGFLRFVGFWMGDGHLTEVIGSFAVSQRKLSATAWLVDLLDEVFPYFWRRGQMAKDEKGITMEYVVCCPPLYQWLYVMSVGPPGYNPLEPLQMRRYPHFQPDEHVLKAEAVYVLPPYQGTWTEAKMRAAFDRGVRRRPCCVCGDASGVRVTCSGKRCQHVDSITRAHPRCIRREEEQAFCRPKGRRSEDWPWFCGHAECRAEEKEWADAHPFVASCTATSTSSSSSSSSSPAGGKAKKAKAEEEVDEDVDEVKPQARPTRSGRVPSRPDWFADGGDPEDATMPDAAAAGDAAGSEASGSGLEEDVYAQVAGMRTGIIWNGGVWDIDKDGTWFYRKRWLGPDAVVASTFANLSQPQAVALLEGFNRADGEWGVVDFHEDGTPSGGWSCTNSSMPLIHHMQLIGQLSGARVDLSLHSKADTVSKGMEGRAVKQYVDHWRLTCNFNKVYGAQDLQLAQLAQPKPAIDIDRKGRVKADNRGFYQHVDDGYVYDITVDGNENFLTQRLSEKPIKPVHHAAAADKLAIRAHPVFVGNCFQKVVDSQNTHCPTCRVYLNRDRPIRSRFAESVLSQMLVACPNEEKGCRERVRFGRLSEHEKDACDYRAAVCKYHSIGCDWRGYAKDVRRHAKSCPARSLSVKDILRGVARRNDEVERQRAAERLNHKAYINVTNYLSKRCRDIAIRDVVIDYDPLTKERCANTFMACGLAWQLFLDPMTFAPSTVGAASSSSSTSSPASSTSPVPGQLSAAAAASPSAAVPTPSPSSSTPPPAGAAGAAAVRQDAVMSMHINCISPVKRRTIVIFILLPGPNLDLDLPPTITKVTYTKHATESELFRLRAEDEKVREVYAMDAVNMRVAVIDCSRGRMKRSFGGDAGEESPSEASEEESDADDGRTGRAGRDVHVVHHQGFPVGFEEDDDYEEDEEEEDDDDDIDEDELDAELMGEEDDDDSDVAESDFAMDDASMSSGELPEGYAARHRRR